MKKVLIDTDIILDFFFDRQPFLLNAAKIITLCQTKKVIGFVTPVIVSNVYYMLNQKAKQEKVIEKIKSLLSFLELLIIDKTTIHMALNSEFKDFEDALQNYAAEVSGHIDILITRNTKDYKYSKLAVMNPQEFLKSMETF